MAMMPSEDHIEMGRNMALGFVDDHLDGDEDAQEAVKGASFPGAASVERGQMSATRVVSLIVALTVGAIVAGLLLPIGLAELSGAALGENASSGAEALWGLLDVIIVLAVFLFFIGVALSAVGKI